MTKRASPLNDITIRNLPTPATGEVQIPDGKIAGMGVRVNAGGVKSFYLKFRFNGQYARMHLGRYPSTTLAVARERARAALVMLDAGKDPRAPVAGAMTFAAAVDLFVAQYCRHANRPSSAEETEKLLRSYFVPAWGKRSVESIGKGDVTTAIEVIMKRGKMSAARHAFAAIRRFFNWMVEQGRLAASPCAGLKPPGKHVSRDRVLTDDELRAIWKHTGTHADTAHTLIRLLILTAQRTGEVCGIAWDEIDETNAVWTIPADRTKNHKPHAVPLTATALAIIAEIPRTDSPLVFPARGKPTQPYAGYTKPKMAIDAAANVSGWTLHDLRRTAATGMAKLAVAPHVIERILNHVSGTFAGVSGVYNRFQYLPEMRAALETWERHVLAITADQAEVRAA